MEYVAFTDGSFKELKGVGAFYASAAIIAPAGTTDWAQIVKVSNDEYIKHKNVAGELMAVIAVCEHCINVLHLTPEDKLTIYYDYFGVERWLKNPGEENYWRANNELTQTYREYMRKYVRPKFQYETIWAKGHSGITGNEIVDKLARGAIDQRLLEEMSKLG